MKTKQLFYTVILIGLMSINLNGQVQEVIVPFSDNAQLGKLDIKFLYGPTTIKGTDRKDILIRYSPMEDEKPTPKELKEGLKKVRGIIKGVKINEYKNEVSLRYDNLNQDLRFEIETPKQIDLKINVSSESEINVDNISGIISLKSFGGDITAQKISGSLVANSEAGDITVGFERITPQVPLSFATFSGKIDLTFPSNTKANFKIHTETGEIYTGFDMTFSQPYTKKSRGKDQSKVHSFVNEWVHSQLNGGGSEITIKNYSGDIYIRKKQ